MQENLQAVGASTRTSLRQLVWSSAYLQTVLEGSPPPQELDPSPAPQQLHPFLGLSSLELRPFGSISPTTCWVLVMKF